MFKKGKLSVLFNKNHRDGTIAYHHNALSGVVVHPDLSEALAVATEGIQKVFRRYLWIRVRQIFDLMPVKNMETIFKIINKDVKLKIELLS